MKNRTETDVVRVEDSYLSLKDVAGILGVSIHTPRKWLARNQMPLPDIRGHRFIRWHQSTLEEFLKEPLLWRKNNCK